MFLRNILAGLILPTKRHRCFFEKKITKTNINSHLIKENASFFKEIKTENLRFRTNLSKGFVGS